jgi:aminocarboxymuconate-semialdehyde decarboxylase
MASRQAIDVHAHVVPPAILDEAERSPRAFGGVEVRRGPEGPVVVFPGVGALRPLRPPMLSVEQRPGWLAERGMDVQIAGAWMDAVGDTLPAETQEAWSQRFNEAMAELAQQSEGRLRMLATLPLRRPAAAARELERAVRELGMVGAMIGSDVADVDLAAEALDPLWEAARSLAVPIVLHPTYTGPGAGLSPRNYVNLYGRTIDTTYCATRLIVAGLFDRHPDVTIVLVHGGGFLPYQAERLDTCFRAGDLGHVTLGRERPSAYLPCFCYDTALLTGPAARMLVETVGPERVMLGTDYPFPIADGGAVGRLSGALADSALGPVLRGNAERIFRLAD